HRRLSEAPADPLSPVGAQDRLRAPFEAAAPPLRPSPPRGRAGDSLAGDLVAAPGPPLAGRRALAQPTARGQCISWARRRGGGRAGRFRPRTPGDTECRGAALGGNRLPAGYRSGHSPQTLWPGPQPPGTGLSATGPAGGQAMTDVTVQHEVSVE